MNLSRVLDNKGAEPIFCFGELPYNFHAKYVDAIYIYIYIYICIYIHIYICMHHIISISSTNK